MMKLDSKSYVEVGLVLSFVSFASFLGTQYGRINAAEAQISSVKGRLIQQIDLLSEIRERLGHIEGMLQRSEHEGRHR